jgi:hypothetical protein
MSAAVSSFEFPISRDEAQGLTPEQVSAFAFHVSRDAALQQRAIELPRVVPASRLGERPPVATVLTGIEALDALTGGLPRVGLSEIVGADKRADGADGATDAARRSVRAGGRERQF